MTWHDYGVGDLYSINTHTLTHLTNMVTSENMSGVTAVTRNISVHMAALLRLRLFQWPLHIICFPLSSACSSTFEIHLYTYTFFYTIYSIHQHAHISRRKTCMKNICIYLLMTLSDNCCVLMNNSCRQLMIQIPHLSSPLALSKQ